MKPYVHGWNSNNTGSNSDGWGYNTPGTGLSATDFPDAVAVPPARIQHRPSGVVIHNTRGGTIKFNFTTTGSIASDTLANGTWIDFTSATGSQLQISPTAWSGSDASAAAGDVIFVYNDGRPK